MKNKVFWTSVLLLLFMAGFVISMLHANSIMENHEKHTGHLWLFVGGMTLAFTFVMIPVLATQWRRHGKRKQPFFKAIPENLEDALKALSSIGVPDVDDWKKMKEDDAIAHAHHVMGQWLRNEWGLWGDNKLTAWFNGLGIKHPDDMSSIILTSFHRALNNRDVDLDGQVESYRDFWKKEDPSML